MDAEAAKKTLHQQWAGAAAGWGKHDAVLQSHLAPVTLRMVADLQPGQQVLDLCSGTGEPALAAAPRVLPGGRVTGIDFADEMLAFARDKARQRGLGNLEFRQMDAEALEFPAGSFDAATFRFGLMFMPNPAGCLSGLRRVLKRGSAVSVSCWAEPARNLWLSLAGQVARNYVEIPAPEPGTPGVFAFADPEKLRAVLVAAGFTTVRVEPLDLVMSDYETGAEFVAMNREVSSTLRALINRIPAGRQAEFTTELAAEVERAGGGRAHLTGRTWLASARS